MLRISALCGIVLVALAPACGGSGGQLGSQPSWRKPNEVQSSNTARPVAPPRPIVFDPEGEATAAYNDPPVKAPPPSGLGDAIVGAIEDLAAEHDFEAPVPDGRLFAAAEELAGVVPENGPLPYPLVEFAMQRHGIIEPSPHLVVMWGPLDDPDAILEQLAPQLPEILVSGRFARVAVGSARRTDAGEGVAILALQPSFVDTEPIPRELPDGGVIRLDGRLEAPYGRPEIFVTHEDGSVEQPNMVRTEKHAFLAEVSCAGRVGQQQIEITGVDESGSTVLANFPVWCNAEAPSSLTVEPSEDDYAPVTSAAAAEKRMVELVNRDRTEYGLPPLEWDERVAEVARAHSREMASSGVVAHVSPTTGSAADRVQDAGIRSAVILENVARAYGVAEAQAGLMNSPGHRANVLSESATHIGVGLVLGEPVAGRHELFITQVFTRVPPRIDRGTAKKRLRETLDREVSYLARVPTLDTLAQELADGLGAGLSNREAAATIRDDLARLGGFREISTIVTTVADVEAFDPDAALGGATMTHYGMGVAQGNHETMGEGAVYIVLLVALK